ncbi:MAG TPA: hypothetical protein VEJ67_08690 [Candidatus Cybelea sp.]|nr:hypothetical protein [Candidatus Cybelea sp.]
MPTAGQIKCYIAQAVDSATSLFEQLVFLGSLRDSYTGQYLREGWGRVASADEIHSVLRDFHRAMFLSVLRLPLLELSKQLRYHFQALGQPERQTAFFWLEVEPFRDLIPQGCSALFRELFISQIRTALEVLCDAPDWVELAGPVTSPDPQLGPSPLLRWLN